MNEPDHIVFVVDDDPSFRRSAGRLLQMAGHRFELFSSAQHFLERQPPKGPACLVTDLRMPGMSGLELQRELANRHRAIPVIFITGQGDVSTSVRAMKAGAVDFLTKPFHEQDFLSAVSAALDRDRARRRRDADQSAVRERYNSLTPREREVMSQVATGMPNKQVAAALDVAERTVKFHRAHIMDKMLAPSFAALVQMAIDLGLRG